MQRTKWVCVERRRAISSLRLAAKRPPTEEKVPATALSSSKSSVTSGSVDARSQCDPPTSVSLFDSRKPPLVYSTSAAKWRTIKALEASCEQSLESFGTVKKGSSSCF